MAAENLEELVSLCKRRGFIFPGSDLYGGLQGTYDYGPLGVELKNNLKAAWWSSMVYERDDMEGLDASILTHRHVLKYSGHEATFTDPLVDNRENKKRYRLDHLIKEQKEGVRHGLFEAMGLKHDAELADLVKLLLAKSESSEQILKSCGVVDPTSGAVGNWTAPRAFNMMFKTQIGPVADENSYGYLRPETAQGIFVNFKNVLDSTSKKLPFGIAQIGKSFRNEITPRNFIFRVREFEQMEIEYFVRPGDDESAHQEWLEARLAWWEKQGLPREKVRVLDVPASELAHYSKRTYDLMYDYPTLGFEEIEGIANRSDYDLGSHTRSQSELALQATVMPNTDSTSKLAILDEASKKWIVPFVIEPSAGVDRGVLAVLSEAFVKETLEAGGERIVLKLKPHLAPIKVAVVPLAKNKEEITSLAKDIKNTLQKKAWGRILYEDTGNVGKAYRRHDEIGTPFCVTVDYDTVGKSADGSSTLKDTVTVRERDSMAQTRVPISELTDFLQTKLF